MSLNTLPPGSAPARRPFRPVLEQLEDRSLLAAPTQFLQRGLSAGGVFHFPSLSPHDPAEMYMTTDMSQVFHSTNLGVSWDYYDFREYSVSNKLSGVEFTADPQVLYGLHTPSSAFARPVKSVDAGASWYQAGSALFPSDWPGNESAWRLFADPTSANRVLVATQGKLYSSSDGGQHFSVAYTYSGAVDHQQGTGFWAAGVFFDPTDPSRVWAGTNAGLLVSTNGGAIFTTANVPGIPANEVMVSFAGAQENGVTRFYAVTIDTASLVVPLPTNTSYPFTAYRDLYTLDWGQAAWTANTAPLDAAADLGYVALAPNDLDTVYIAGQFQTNKPYVGKFTTGSGQWASVLTTSQQGNNIYTGYVGPGGHLGFSPSIIGLAVSPTDPNRVLITDAWAPHLTTDGGQTWHQVYVDPSEEHAPGTLIPHAQEYGNTGANNTSVWWAEWTSPTSMWVAYDDVVGQRSQDGGQTWSFDYTGLTPESHQIRKHPGTGTLYIAQGRNWPAHTTLGLSDAKVDPYPGSVRYSTDNGATWQVLANLGHPVAWLDFDPNDPSTMYVSVQDSQLGGIYVSHNLSSANPTFAPLSSQPPRTQGRPLTIEVLDDGTLVATFTGRRSDATGKMTASSGVFVGTPQPGGTVTWQDVSVPAMYYWTKDLTVDPHDPTQSTWYVAVSGAIPPVEDPSIPINQGGLYMTRDRGQHWYRVFTRDGESAAVSPTNPDEMYLCTLNNGLWYTSNLTSVDASGNPNPTFTQVLSYPHRRPSRVFFNPYDANEVWVAGNGGGLMVGNAALQPAAVSFSAPSYTAPEDGGGVTITATRSGDVANTMTVAYLVTAGTASVGEFSAPMLPTGVSGTLTFHPGQAGVSFSVAILDDGAVEGDETVQLSLKNPSNDVALGVNSLATLTILDNDVPPSPPPPPPPTPGAAGPPPEIVDIRVHYGSRSSSILDLGRTLPWLNIDTIDVVFSEHVHVDGADLELTGLGGSYAFAGFRYDPTSFTASWTLGTVLPRDRLTLVVSGGVEDVPAIGDPNLLAGGDYHLAVAVLPGDWNGDGRLTKRDLNGLERRRGTDAVWADLNGDGIVNNLDLRSALKRWRRRQLRRLP